MGIADRRVLVWAVLRAEPDLSDRLSVKLIHHRGLRVRPAEGADIGTAMPALLEKSRHEGRHAVGVETDTSK